MCAPTIANAGCPPACCTTSRSVGAAGAGGGVEAGGAGAALVWGCEGAAVAAVWTRAARPGEGAASNAQTSAASAGAAGEPRVRTRRISGSILSASSDGEGVRAEHAGARERERDEAEDGQRGNHQQRYLPRAPFLEFGEGEAVVEHVHDYARIERAGALVEQA